MIIMMGIKKKRVSLSSIVYKDGKRYAQDSTRLRPVCDCMVFYRNCMKCNLKLAKRHSDYISLMVKHCRESSISRKITRPHENHDFCIDTFYKMIYKVISESKMLCQCELCVKNNKKHRLSIRGENKLSLDRVYDNMGYTHKDQILRLVSKSHHSWQKRNSIPINSLRKRNWVCAVKDGILKRSRFRQERIKIEIINMEQAGLDTSEIKKQLQSHVITPEECHSMILEKKNNTTKCVKCEIELDYGDENGYVFTNGEPRRASADRINNRMGYIPENVRMVCFSCQTIESIDDREDLFLDENEFIELLNYIRNKIK